MKETPETCVKMEQLAKLRQLFIEKQWKIDRESELSVFQRYYKTLSLMTEQEQEFFISLSKRFIHMNITHYMENLIEPLSKIRKDHEKDNLAFLPCLPEKDFGEIKSATAVLYQLKGGTLKYTMNLKPYDVYGITPETLNLISSKERQHIVLVDDFIGTGKTASEVVDYVRTKVDGKIGISLLCIVAMRRGIEVLREKGIEVYCKLLCSRGISDYYLGAELHNAISCMKGIEKRIKVRAKFQFGYAQSEALVCMERCPNNTFPIYWQPKNISPYERW